jgi:hypothetical protein
MNELLLRSGWMLALRGLSVTHPSLTTTLMCSYEYGNSI